VIVERVIRRKIERVYLERLPDATDVVTDGEDVS
jgi:hypothetical protein